MAHVPDHPAVRLDIGFDQPAPAARRAMAGIEAAVGVPAVPGGIGLIRDGMSMDRGWIDHTLLPGWEIPGVLLIAVVGVGMLTAAVLTIRHPAMAAPVAMAAGALLVAWIAVETLMVGWHGGPQAPLAALVAVAGVSLLALGGRYASLEIRR